MKFILPTQSAPKQKIIIDDVTIFPYRRVEIVHSKSSKLYMDAMVFEFKTKEWEKINELIAFHAFVFDDHWLLNWYESENFGTKQFNNYGECICPVDYSNISNRIYFPDNEYTSIVNYKDLYNDYISLGKEDKSLVRGYLNCIEYPRSRSQNRRIRDNDFWGIVKLYSIVEKIVGESEYCTEKVSCKIHGELFPHHKFGAKEWINERIFEIVQNRDRAREYAEVVLHVREKIRHKTVHNSVVPESNFIEQESGVTIVWDWDKTKLNWEQDKTALFNLEIQIKNIARNLLLNKIFKIDHFPKLKHLKSFRIAK